MTRCVSLHIRGCHSKAFLRAGSPEEMDFAQMFGPPGFHAYAFLGNNLRPREFRNE